MKRNLLLILLAAGMLSACSAVGQPPATALPTVVLGGDDTPPALDSSTPAPSQPDNVGAGGVTASGIVIPAHQARLAFSLAGRIETINVAAGDQVKAGQVLAELDYFTVYAQAGQAGSSLKELTSPASIAAAERE